MKNSEYKELEEKMQKQIAAYEKELSSVRAGRASPAILDKIHVDYHGTPTPINQIAAVKATDARTITITPWEPSVIKGIEKAIQVSDLGVTPTNDGKMIRLAFPQLTEERRKELTKHIAKLGEDAKVGIRNIRRVENDKYKEMKKNSDITEDDLKTMSKDLQDITDKYIKEIDTITAAKNKELMEL